MSLRRGSELKDIVFFCFADGDDRGLCRMMMMIIIILIP